MTRPRTPLLLTLLVGISACGGDAPPSETQPDSRASSAPSETAPAAGGTSAGDDPAGFCTTAETGEIREAFGGELPLAGVDVANDSECRYQLDLPGAEVALLIYRLQPVTMYEAYSKSSQKTADIPDLGAAAILLGDAQVEVKLDDERALEVTLQVVNVVGEPLPLTPDEATEGLIRLARLLASRLSS